MKATRSVADRPSLAGRNAINVSANGEFVLNDLDEGRYRLASVSRPAGAYVSSVRIGNTNHPDMTFEVRANTNSPCRLRSVLVQQRFEASCEMTRAVRFPRQR